MAAPVVVFYVSGHGFGHASRDIEIINALHRLAPGVQVVVRTSAPRWIFDLTLAAPTGWMPAECDTGIVQIDSLRLDIDATLQRADAFHASLPARAATEAALLREIGATLVVGDIPPLAFAAAAAAGLPSMAVGNFTWDWIYSGYEETRKYPNLVPTIENAYRSATRALRLPLGGGFEAFEHVERVPFVARRSKRRRDEVRRQFGLPADARLVLASFGGYGLRDIDIARLGGIARWEVVVTSNVQASRRATDAGVDRLERSGWPPAIHYVDEHDIYAAGFRYEDIVAAVDVVATKPGYGIIAECIANGAAMLYTSRGRFVEYDVMVREMPRYLRCQFISNEDLYAGRWERPLAALMAQPPPPESPRVDGAEVVAGVVREMCGR
jgi:hypothetical protein